MKTISIRFNDHLANWIMGNCQKNKITISEFIRDLLYSKMQHGQIDHKLKINKQKYIQYLKIKSIKDYTIEELKEIIGNDKKYLNYLEYIKCLKDNNKLKKKYLGYNIEVKITKLKTKLKKYLPTLLYKLDNERIKNIDIK